eukprot:CAMPEP_0182445628 /NCGR_PEP_ID=MMETSP1172-20130603/3693_1 /TAXON_ID=708627 /ORGANISM="Timspurckia oligopyrenoides, Strain CCMP3278" /LENGTH=416 /DNA_ID=CAMNT_0024641435 /DNA_START=1858 /DNA_END=3108 /DNA_ORIENTATION=-
MPLHISGVGVLSDDVKRAKSIAKCWADPYLGGNLNSRVLKDQVMQVPQWVIDKCYGVCFLFYLKAGFIWSGGLGTGFVMSKLHRGTPQQRWSAPSAITAGGMGWGAQIGAQKIFHVIFLNSKAAVQTFASHGKVNIGGDLGVALGPVGRQGSVRAEAGNKGVAATYSYSFTQGAFAGINLDGTIVGANGEMNRKYYGESGSISALLKGETGLDAWKSQPDLAQLYLYLDTALTTTGAQEYDMNYGDVPLSSVAGSVAGSAGMGVSSGNWWDSPGQSQRMAQSSRGMNTGNSDNNKSGNHTADAQHQQQPTGVTTAQSFNASRYGVAASATRDTDDGVRRTQSQGGYWGEYFQKYGDGSSQQQQPQYGYGGSGGGYYGGSGYSQQDPYYSNAASRGGYDGYRGQYDYPPRGGQHYYY